MSTLVKRRGREQDDVEAPPPRMYEGETSSDESSSLSDDTDESEIRVKNLKSEGAAGIGDVSLVTQIYGKEEEDIERYNTPEELLRDFVIAEELDDDSESSSETPLGNPNAILLRQIVARRAEEGYENTESERPDPPDGEPGIDRQVVADDIAVDLNDTEQYGSLEDEYIQDNPDYILVFRHHEHESHQDFFKNVLWTERGEPHLFGQHHPDASLSSTEDSGDESDLTSIISDAIDKTKTFLGAGKTFNGRSTKAPEGKGAEWYDFNRRTIVGALRYVGLIVRQVESADRESIYVQIWAPLDVLEKRATQLAIVTGCKDGYNFKTFEGSEPCYIEEAAVGRSIADHLYYGFKGKRKAASKSLGDYMSEEFNSDDRWKFKPLNASQRMMLVRNLITAPRDQGGADIKLGRLIAQGKMISEFAMHDPVEQKELHRKWIGGWSFFKAQPLDDVAAYFGEKLGFYFAFLGFYTMFLSVPALLGLGVFIHGLIVEEADVESTPWFIVFLMFWAVVFLEEWQRKQHRLAFRWDMDDFTSVETSRDLYQGRLACGFFTKHGFIHLNAEAYQAYGVDTDLVPKEIYFPRWKTTWRSTGAYFLCLVTIVALFFLYLAILYGQHELEVKIDGTQPKGAIKWGSILGGIIMGLAIAIVNQVWVRVAKALCSWENHRTHSEYETALIVKIFVVQFFNSFFALFYAAYLKRENGIMNTLFGVADSCENNDCMQEVANMLGSIMISGAAIGQVQETVLPWVFSRINRAREQKQAAALGRARTQTEIQNDLVPFESTIPEYSELVIQYGYVALFASAFPFGATLAFLNNLIEIRTDANKILNVNRRALYEGAKDIGMYYYILQIMSAAAIINNTFMVAFVSGQLETYYGGELTTVERLVFVVIVEHLFFLFKMILAWHIPDVPSDVQKMRIRQANKAFIVLDGAEARRDRGTWPTLPIASKSELSDTPRGDSMSDFSSNSSGSSASSGSSSASSSADSSSASTSASSS